MYCKVKRLRRHGERISDREISSDSGVVGHMTICRVETSTRAKLHGARDDSRQNALFPELHSAKVVAMTGDRMLFQGYERVGRQDDPEAPMIKQEWAVQVMVAAPL